MTDEYLDGIMNRGQLKTTAEADFEKWWARKDDIVFENCYLVEPSVLIHFHLICIYASKREQKKESFFQHPSSAGRPPTGIWP